jgi:hypothetical protein
MYIVALWILMELSPPWYIWLIYFWSLINYLTD